MFFNFWADSVTPNDTVVGVSRVLPLLGAKGGDTSANPAKASKAESPTATSASVLAKVAGVPPLTPGRTWVERRLTERSPRAISWGDVRPRLALRPSSYRLTLNFHSGLMWFI
jgi:hypothetical protein